MKSKDQRSMPKKSEFGFRTGSVIQFPETQEDVRLICQKFPNGKRIMHIFVTLDGIEKSIPINSLRQEPNSKSARRKFKSTFNAELLYEHDDDYSRVMFLLGKTLKVKKQIRTFCAKMDSNTHRPIIHNRNLKVNKVYYKIPVFEIINHE